MVCVEAKHTGLPGFYGLPLKTRKMLAHFSHCRRTAITEYGSRRPRLLACGCFHTLSTSLIRLCKPQRSEGWDGVMVPLGRGGMGSWWDGVKMGWGRDEMGSWWDGVVVRWGHGGIISHISQELKSVNCMPCANVDALASFFLCWTWGWNPPQCCTTEHTTWPLACFREDQTLARNSPGSLPSGRSFY